MCPIVPTFTCGFVRSNFSFAMRVILEPASAAPTAPATARLLNWSR
jgi:hypothetical protein